MIKNIVNTLKANIFGQLAKGEKVVIPDLRKLHQKLDRRFSPNKVNEGYNRWCSEVNFSGMYTKHD